MTNMSYCRFENTSSDLSDCFHELEKAVEDGVGMAEFRAKLSSNEERRALERMRDQCQEFVDFFDEMAENDEVTA